jgi:putative transposase
MKYYLGGYPMDKITHEMRINRWQQIIKECNNSGMTKKEWCLQNGVHEKAFYYWQRRIRKRAVQVQSEYSLPPAAANFVELTAPTPVVSHQPVVNNIAATIQVNGCRIELSETASEPFIQRLLGALAYVQ